MTNASPPQRDPEAEPDDANAAARAIPPDTLEETGELGPEDEPGMVASTVPTDLREETGELEPGDDVDAAPRPITDSCGRSQAPESEPESRGQDTPALPLDLPNLTALVRKHGTVGSDITAADPDDEEILVDNDAGFGSSAAASLIAVGDPTPAAARRASAADQRKRRWPLVVLATVALVTVAMGLSIAMRTKPESATPTPQVAAVAHPPTSSAPAHTEAASESEGRGPQPTLPRPVDADAAEQQPTEQHELRSRAAAQADGTIRSVRRRQNRSIRAASPDRDVSEPAEGSTAAGHEVGAGSTGATAGGTGGTAAAATGAEVPEQDQASYTAECLLDPSKPGCGTPTTGPAEPQAPAPERELPAKLGAIDIRTGFSAVKPSAKHCGRLHGAPSDTKVLVKVSIEGASGKVVSARPMGDHADTEIGRCVALALSQARFKRFQKKRMGVTYPIRF